MGELDKEKTTESDLKEYFSSFGTVLECTLVREATEVEGEEGASKGYAFLLMSTIEETDAILKHPTPHVIHDKELVVNRASPHTVSSTLSFNFKQFWLVTFGLSEGFTRALLTLTP